MALGRITAGGAVGNPFGDGSDGVLNDNLVIKPLGISEENEKFGTKDVIIKQFSSIDLPSDKTVTIKPCGGVIMLVNGNVDIAGTITHDGSSVYGSDLSEYIYNFNDSTSKVIINKIKNLKGGLGGSGGRGSRAYSSGNYYGSNGGSGGGSMPEENIPYRCGGAGGGGGGCGLSLPYQSLADDLTGSSVHVSNFVNLFASSLSSKYSPCVEEKMVYAGLSPFNAYNNNGGYGMCFSPLNREKYYSYGSSESYGAGSGGGGFYADLNQLSFNSSSVGASGQNVGGFICIISKGNMSISNTALISCNGGAGGKGGSGNKYSTGGGGGGAGGGVVALFHKGVINNLGSITVNGGIGGAGGGGTATSGSAGSVGTIIVEKL